MRHRSDIPRFSMKATDGPMRATVSIDLNPVFRHVNEFLGLRCAADLLELGVYPQQTAAKEITEAMATFAAVRRVLGVESFGDDTIRLLDIGAGRSPRAGALFAFRTRWQVTSIDPLLEAKWQGRIRRFTCHTGRIQDVNVEHAHLVVITLVHAHVEVLDVLRAVKAPDLLIVALPCCVPHTLPMEPQLSYSDFGCWSPQRTIKAWRMSGAMRDRLVHGQSV